MGHEPSAKGRPWWFDRLTLAGIHHDLDAVDHVRVVYNARLGSERNCGWRLERFLEDAGLGARDKVDGQTQAGQGDMVCYSRR